MISSLCVQVFSSLNLYKAKVEKFITYRRISKFRLLKKEGKVAVLF
jgi:hypothetical protein